MTKNTVYQVMFFSTEIDRISHQGYPCTFPSSSHFFSTITPSINSLGLLYKPPQLPQRRNFLRVTPSIYRSGAVQWRNKRPGDGVSQTAVRLFTTYVLYLHRQLLWNLELWACIKLLIEQLIILFLSPSFEMFIFVKN